MIGLEKFRSGIGHKDTFKSFSFSMFLVKNSTQMEKKKGGGEWRMCGLVTYKIQKEIKSSSVLRRFLAFPVF